MRQVEADTARPEAEPVPRETDAAGVEFDLGVEDIVLECGADPWPLVPASDQYIVAFHRADWRKMFGTTKLMLSFGIVQPPAYAHIRLTLFANRHRDVRPGQNFYRYWMLAAGQAPRRRDRMSTRVFRHKLFRASVKTVTKTQKGTAHDPVAQYSVITDLLEKVTG